MRTNITDDIIIPRYKNNRDLLSFLSGAFSSKSCNKITVITHVITAVDPCRLLGLAWYLMRCKGVDMLGHHNKNYTFLRRSIFYDPLNLYKGHCVVYQTIYVIITFVTITKG
jgi:hypothetical protein